MELICKRAGAEDIDVLTATRLEILRAANGLAPDADLSALEPGIRAYYQEALQTGAHVAYLVFDGEKFAGAGGVSFYRVLPTCHIPTGEKAYIMNLYTRPEYRRRGIATHTLDLLVRAAHERGVTAISLEATDMGRPLYERYGFVPMTSEMELPCD